TTTPAPVRNAVVKIKPDKRRKPARRGARPGAHATAGSSAPAADSDDPQDPPGATEGSDEDDKWTHMTHDEKN
ncbi:MAG TPA: hypothetical protein VFP84_35645, partial [Kofleriaceae bacterium]|nr:hypothetical protein [Kofleriaceae bacterium]